MPSVAPAKARLGDGLVQDESSESDAVSVSTDAGSDSDSLDSVSPRKRRRASPPDASDDEGPKIIKSSFNVPSRIKRTKLQPENKAEAARSLESRPDPAAASRVTAPTDANTTFDSLGVRPWLVQSLANMAIKRPTAIQRESIPMLLKGRDCIGGSRTGSGKTVAFTVPILQKWAENPSAIFGVILTPTR
jgi:ATP-dependent RNA helicase DDX49/DBP8